jgi:hypothetical protein
MVLTEVLAEICMSASSNTKQKVSKALTTRLGRVRVLTGKMPVRKVTASSEALLRKYNTLLEASRGPASDNSSLETARLYQLETTFAAYGLEVRQWQDGTLSDFGDRPIGCRKDLWLPAQLKTTTSTVYPFQFKGCGKEYGMDIIALTGNVDEAFVYSAEFLEANVSKMLSNGPSKEHRTVPNAENRDIIKVTSGARGVCVWNIPRLHVAEVAQQRLVRWHDELLKYDKGLPSILRTERELRMQCHSKSRCEFLHSELSMRFDSAVQHRWAPPQLVYDRLRDDVPVQDKPAIWNSNTDSTRYTALVTKRLNGGHVPYELGDLQGGLFVMSTVHVGLRLFLEWRIPEEDMDGIFQALLHRGADGKFCTPGCQTINLSVLGEHDENMDLHMKIFGRLPKAGTDRRAARFLHIHELPSSYSIDPCLEGRDPVPRAKRKRGSP